MKRTASFVGGGSFLFEVLFSCFLNITTVQSAIVSDVFCDDVSHGMDGQQLILLLCLLGLIVKRLAGTKKTKKHLKMLAFVKSAYICTSIGCYRSLMAFLGLYWPSCNWNIDSVGVG